jgi:hypothetical protein
VQDIWRAYEAQISELERASIQAAPVLQRPTQSETFTYFSSELAVARWRAHARVPQLAAALSGGNLNLEVVNVRFAECLAIAIFELRHGFIASWHGFAVLFHQMLGPAVLPWVPSLFLAAVGQANVTRPQFDLGEVLGFTKLA